MTGIYDSEMWCRARMGHKEHCYIGPIPFWWFLMPFYMLLVSSNFDFSGTAYHRDSKPMPMDSACLQPYIGSIQAFWCFYPSQNQQNVKYLPEILLFQELLDQKMTKKMCNLIQGKSALNPWNMLHMQAILHMLIIMH